MKKIRKILISLLLLVMVTGGTAFNMNQNLKNVEADTFGCYSYEVLADDTIKITKCNVNFESGDMHTEDLSIPGEIDGKKVVCIGSYAFANLHQAILNVTVPDGVTTIESHAFEGCKSISCVTLPNTVASIGEQAFYNCKELESINIPKNAIIGKDAFAGCEKLKLDNEPQQTTVNETTTVSENNTTVPKKNETTTGNVSIEKTKVNKVTKKLASKKAVIKLKKVNGAKYQVMISMTKKFNKKKTITRKVNKATFTVKNKILQKKKVLYVKARAYKVLNGKIYYSKWSNVKKVVIKK